MARKLLDLFFRTLPVVPRVQAQEDAGGAQVPAAGRRQQEQDGHGEQQQELFAEGEGEEDRQAARLRPAGEVRGAGAADAAHAAREDAAQLQVLPLPRTGLWCEKIYIAIGIVLLVFFNLTEVL